MSFHYGNPGDVPFMGDWDCDTVATPGLFRTSDAFAYLRNSNTQGIANIRFFFGNPSDIPLAGDFNNDGCDTLSIYRPSEARFYIINKLGADGGGLGAADYTFLFGDTGDKPVVGAGYRYIHSALDDRTRITYSEILNDEKAATAAAFWERAANWFTTIGITPKPSSPTTAPATNQGCGTEPATPPAPK